MSNNDGGCPGPFSLAVDTISRHSVSRRDGPSPVTRDVCSGVVKGDDGATSDYGVASPVSALAIAASSAASHWASSASSCAI